MKKAIITLAITAFFITATMALVLLPSTNEKNNKLSVENSRAERYLEVKDSLQKYTRESEAKIARYEVSIAEYQKGIAIEKSNNKIRFAKKVAVILR